MGLELPARSRRSLALTCAPAFAVSALTVQTQEDALEIQFTQPGLVTDQMRAALQANRVAGTKVGMLATAEIIVAAVAAVLREYRRISTVQIRCWLPRQAERFLKQAPSRIMK
ncbi:bifunctional hydroxymethylpyrimidine kinase/phosphomethylpyrimidine kinase [Mesorhizobium sp. M1004]|uniref:bifunctional hydroxymethylpyrimidine kinase/phosphomethylpyrimidine kinase n=1 Tax=Mesorhizobium sp. M1004 TaxID=2957046 RepID=UPI00333BB55F